jgi:hypothetical protein
MGPNSTSDDEVARLKRELDRSLQSASNEGQTIANAGHDIAASGQHVVDWAQATRGMVPFISDPKVLGDLSASWDRTAKFVHSFVGQVSSISTASLTSTADSSGISSVLNLSSIARAIPTVGLRAEDASDAITRIRSLADREDVKTEVVILLKHLGLDVAAKGRLSAAEQLNTAHKEYLVNASEARQASTWLIPMRECILGVLASLLRRRPRQEKVKSISKKVNSIIEQLGRDDLPPGHATGLAEQGEQILETGLSPSKQKQMERLDSASILTAATIWLRALLLAIDPAKSGTPTR